jgi:protein involved in polysaccharide export with SLBB domain
MKILTHNLGFDFPILAAVRRLLSACRGFLLLSSLTPRKTAALFLLAGLFAASAVCAQISEGAASTGASPSAGAGSSLAVPGLGLEEAASPAGLSRETEASGLSINALDMALTTRQIFNLIEDKPEVVVELKQLMADTLSQQGVSVDPNSVTDEMLYRQIASSREVRATITLFLRGRGYVSDEEMQSGAAGGQTGGLAGDQYPLLPGDTMGPLEMPDMLSPLCGATAAGTPLLSSCMPGTRQDPSDYAQLPLSAQRTNRAVATEGRKAPRQPNITDAPEVLREPAPYNLNSLRDLYTQVPDAPEKLKRFGSEVFLNRSVGMATRLGGSASLPTLDVPIGPDYVIGPGDSLTINMWGGVSQTITRTIDRDGSLMLPEAGEVQLAGLTLERAQDAIDHALRQQFRNAQITVTIARLRSVRVYVVGDVQSPGAYDIPSLSTVLSALYAAGGPSAAGSLRVVRHYRGKQLLEEIDLYDFLLRGVHGTDDRLEAGDTLVVPPAGPQVAVSGAVRRAAIYELKGEQTLDQVLDVAGGMTVAAALGHITVERIDANLHRETLTLNSDAPDQTQGERTAMASFAVKDGDRIRVAPILPYSERVIYLEGHVARPGRTAFRDGMRLNDVLRSYRDLLPEPSDRAEIVRLVPPDLHPETIEFELPEALIGNENPALQPFDTIRVFGRYEADAPKVTVSGEVLRPGSYPMSAGMTAAQLVRMAGGFKRDALLTDADLLSYRVVNGTEVAGVRSDIRIGDAVRGDAAMDAPLMPGDVLTIHQVTGWEDIGSSITIEGEVGHPGNYGFQQGEHLSDVLRRAGGLRETAYPEGAVLTRVEVRDLEEKSRAELIRQIETGSATARISPSLAGGDQSASVQLVKQQEDQVLARLRTAPLSGRLVIHISADINSWAGTPDDIEVRKGDVLRVPKRPGFVLVSGQVYNATAITFAPGETAGWYLSRAGGATGAADRKDIFVIRANGSVVGRRSDSWGRGVLDTKLDPGDVVVVPPKIIGASLFWRNLLSGAQITSSIAIAAAVATGL